MIKQLLPTRLRMASNRAGQLARDLRNAVFAPRRARSRESVQDTPFLRVVPDVAEEVVEPSPNTSEVFEALSPPQRGGLRGNEAPSILFKQAGVVLQLEDGETILEAGLNAGMDLDYSCAAGGCATCMLKMLDGEVEYDWDTCLTEEEEADGWVLACVGKPRGRIVIDA